MPNARAVRAISNENPSDGEEEPEGRGCPFRSEDGGAVAGVALGESTESFCDPFVPDTAMSAFFRNR